RMTTESTGRGPSASSQSIVSVTGRGIPLRGNDIDTDRIMPARSLRVVSFEGLERHLFEDDPKSDSRHPLNDPRYSDTTILVVNANFGCGSSREHAPQGLARSGVRAIVGESFSEIFQGNAAMLGIPCFAANHASIDKLQQLIERTPDVALTADVATGTISAEGTEIRATVPAALRDGFLSGQWNPTS